MCQIRLRSGARRAAARRPRGLSQNIHQLLEGYYGVIPAKGVVMPLNVRLTAVEWPSMRTINLDTEYEGFLAGGHAERADIMGCDENGIAVLFCTSDRTGTPKRVMLSHRTV